MNPFISLLILSIGVFALVGLFLYGVRRTRLIACNIAYGTHEGGRITRTLAGTFSARHLLCKQGVGAGLVDLCGVADKPLGTVLDEGVLSDVISVQLLGSAPGTVTMVGAEAIAAGVDVFAGADGKVTALPVAAGTYTRVGVSVTACLGDNDPFEVDPYTPMQVTVT